MKRMFLYGGFIISLLLGSIWVMAQGEQSEKPSDASTKSEVQKSSHPSGDFWGPSEDPFLEMERLHRRMEQLMHSRFGRPQGFGPIQEPSFMEPEIDLEESDQEVVIRCDLPGIEKDKIELTLKNDVVVIRGVREVIQENKTDEGGAKIYRSERSLGSFYRAIPLPTRVDAQNAKATYENGVLTIRLPKFLKEEEKGVQILIT